MLPAGFKVNGVTVGTVSIKTKTIATFLDKQAFGELFSSGEIATRLRFPRNGDTFSNPALAEYREKVSGKLFWGSRKTISDLRKKLTEELNG